MLHFFKKEKGFTLIELIVAIAIFAILVGLVTINLLNSRNQASLTATIDTLIADIKSQQTNAMLGNTQGGETTAEYGIHFNTNSYVLFSGNTFDPSSTANFEITPEESIQISTTFPGENLIFLKGSGEIQGFNTTQNSIQVTHLGNGESKTIFLNKLGTITSVQ